MTNPSNSISVVIPTYRRGEALSDTVRYLLQLAVLPQEILIIDQTEKHPAFIESFFQELDPGIARRITLTKPSITKAMNTGLLEAKGDIVLFLDDDIVPDKNLIKAHSDAYTKCPDAWAVVGQVLQPEEQFQSVAFIRKERGSPLCSDLDFKFNSNMPSEVYNVMAGNLSVKRKQAISVGGFDENFTPPVAFRFETEFAKRIVSYGGKIFFEPAASIRHLRAPSGGTRSRGSHLKSASPIHGVGDYYFALRCGKGIERATYMARRPFREVCTRFHLKHPLYIPVKLIGEFRAIGLAFCLYRKGPCLLEHSKEVEPGT